MSTGRKYRTHTSDELEPITRFDFTNTPADDVISGTVITFRKTPRWVVLSIEDYEELLASQT